jgi:anti-sigma-K factor RskA
MSVDRHEIQQENVGAYLLGALTDYEEAAFLRHLEECPVCSDEVARLRPAVDALPRSVPPVDPPPELKASIMAIVEEEARQRSGGRERDPRPRPLAGLRRRLAAAGEGLSAVRPAVAWAGACVILAMGVLTGYGITKIASDEEATKALVAKVDTARLPSATGSLTVSGQESGASGILRVHGMPELDADSTYQVWIKRGGEVIPGSLFSVGQDGEGTTAVTDGLDDADAVLVTRERAGGARAPSEEPVISVSL